MMDHNLTNINIYTTLNNVTSKTVEYGKYGLDLKSSSDLNSYNNFVELEINKKNDYQQKLLDNANLIK